MQRQWSAYFRADLICESSPACHLLAQQYAGQMRSSFPLSFQAPLTSMDSFIRLPCISMTCCVGGRRKDMLATPSASLFLSSPLLFFHLLTFLKGHFLTIALDGATAFHPSNSDSSHPLQFHEAPQITHIHTQGDKQLSRNSIWEPAA